MRDWVDAVKRYNGDYYHPGVLPPSDIDHRAIYAVFNSADLTDKQLVQIQRGVKYAHENNIIIVLAQSAG
jgi:hypothetical protein